MQITSKLCGKVSKNWSQGSVRISYAPITISNVGLHWKCSNTYQSNNREYKQIIQYVKVLFYNSQEDNFEMTNYSVRLTINRSIFDYAYFKFST